MLFLSLGRGRKHAVQSLTVCEALVAAASLEVVCLEDEVAVVIVRAVEKGQEARRFNTMPKDNFTASILSIWARTEASKKSASLVKGA